jgi:two-component system sensor histidine kinase RpfC
VAKLRTNAAREDVLSAVEAALAATFERDEKTEPARAAAQHAGRPLSILLVEDNFTNGMVLKKLLNQAGHRVVLADSADNALDRLEVEAFDLVVTDLNLPGTSGLDLVKLYRMAHLEEKTPLPFIAVTADVTEESRQRCIEAGMAGVVPKPVDMLQLLTLLETLFPKSAERPVPSGDVGSERLVAISTHPRFNQLAEPVLDTAVLRELHALGGGSGFFRDLVSDFVAEADDLIHKMAEAAKAKDATSFRAHSHALRGSLADIGGRRMYRLCLDFRNPSAQQLEREGEARIAELKDEFRKLRHMLSIEVARLDPTIAEKTSG